MKNKKSIWLGLSIVFFMLTVPAIAGGSSKDGCILKQSAIEQELSSAREQKDTSRVHGLEMALAMEKEHCHSRQEIPAVNDDENPWGDSCEAKRNAIERELTYAREHNNTNQVNGLEKALVEVNTHCSDASIRADLEKKMLEAQDKVKERVEDLQEAQAKGDAKKVAHKQEKLDKSQAELELIRVRLNALKK